MYYNKYSGKLNEETQEKWRVDDNGTIYAICPKCGEIIARSEDEAVKLFQE